VSAIAISEIVFVCLFGGALLGLFLNTALPEHLLSQESQSVVRLGMGTITWMAALLLGLLVASAKGSYDAQRNEITQISANILLLDRVLANYGPETKEVRALLRRTVVRTLDRVWPDESSRAARPELTTDGPKALLDGIERLSPRNDHQRWLQTQALSMVIDLARTRLLLVAQRGSSINVPFLVMLVFWLTIIFVSFGLAAPRNTTVITTLLLCAFSVSGAIFLILQLDEPLQGLARIPSTALRSALTQLGR
jgi:hypothetical protein